MGRKKALTIAALVNGVGLLLTAFMPNYILFTIARFITGLGMRTNQSFSDKKIKKIVYDINTFVDTLNKISNFMIYLLTGGIGVFVVPFNLCVELVGNKYKTPVGLIFHAPYSIGQAILGLIAIGVRDYMTYQIVICIPPLLLL